MAPNTSAAKSSGDKDGEDLTTILDQTQRSDLTLLVASITDSMRNILMQNFDATIGLDKSFQETDMTEDQKLMSADPQTADIEKIDQQRRLKDEYEKDLVTLKMKNLKKNSLKAFDEWREQVLLRIGEVVNNRETVKRQLVEVSPGDAKPGAPTTVGKITETPDRGTNLKFKDLYPPTKNPLTKLSMDQRSLILHAMLLLLLSLEHYSARSRVLLLLLTSSLKLPLKTLEQDEYATAKGLLEGVKELTAQEETKKKVEDHKESRKWKVGLATAAGAAIIGVTGGLAAPLVAAGVGSVMGGLGLGATSAATYLGSVAGSTYLVGGLFGAYGGRMTGNMMDNYARQVEDFEFLPVHTNRRTSENEKEGAKQASDHDHKLRVTICISGWLTEKDEAVKPWRVLGTGAEVFALKYELEAMLNLGNAISGFVTSAAWGYAQSQIISQTIFADLAAAFWPIGLLKAARVIDNPFNIAKNRSEKAGEVLADALINKAQGERPVTLIGYSLGARVIYSCLMSLAKRKAFGLIENAVLVGAPTPSDTSDWRMLRTVVTGRLVNVYSQNDYVLGFMYRTSSLQYGVAGLQAVQGLPSVENVDVSEEVDGHLRYRFIMGGILKKIGFEDLDMQAIEEEQKALAKMEEEEKKRSLRSARKRMQRRQSRGDKEDEAEEAEHEAEEIEKEVQAKTQKSMLTRAVEYFYTPSVPGTKDAGKVAQNTRTSAQGSSPVGTARTGTQKGSAASSQNLAQRAYSVLPSMPHLGRSGAEQETETPDQAANQAQSAGKTTEKAQSYTSRAAGYLPSMPKNLPTMPGLGGRSKDESQPQSKPAQAARDASGVSQRTAQGVASTADEVLRPSVKNVTRPQDNPAIEAAQEMPKRMPVIQQGVVPSAGRQAGTTQAAVKDGTQTAGQAASTTGKKVGNHTADAGKAAISTAAASGDEARDSGRSYARYAASYLPSMPKSIPGFSSGDKATPKLTRQGSGEVRSPPPKLEKRTSSGVRSRPPKLGPRQASSGMQSPS